MSDRQRDEVPMDKIVHEQSECLSCILLSAGESKRFGSSKALAKLNCQTVIEYIQKTLLSSKVAQIIVVLGHNSDEIKPFILKDKKITFIINENFKEGQTSSFKEGLKAVSPNTKGIMLLPVDFPLIKKETLDSLIDYFLKKNPLILIPTYQKKHAHPPIFNINLKSELSNLENSTPLYEIQHKYKDSIWDFSTDDSGVILSFNTPLEFKRLTDIFNQLKSQ